MTAPLPTASRWNTYSRSRYPRLWDRCEHAWCPSVIAGGATVFPLANRSRSFGVGSNLLADVWQVSSGGYSLRNTGTTTEAFIPGTASQLNWSILRAFAGWFSVSGYAGLFWMWDLVGGVNQRTMQLSANANGTLTNYWSTNGFDDGTPLTTTLSLKPGFNHCGLQWNEQQQVRQIFLNGVLAASEARATVNLSPTTNRLGILATPALTGNASFIGNVDDIRIYSRALHPEEWRLLATRRAIAYEPATRPAYYTETDAGGGGVAKPVLFHSYYMSQGMRP